MDSATAQKLAALNRQFYADHALAFAHRRATPQPGIIRILDRLPPNASVLEIGCGDGKVARALMAHPNVIAYLGLDLDPTLLARARAGMRDPTPTPPLPRLQNTQTGEGVPSPVGAFPDGAQAGLGWGFALADLTSHNWHTSLPPTSFTAILAFSVFHHLPGAATRARVLRTLAGHLAPSGFIAMSNWQFNRSERLQKRLIPWSTLGLTESDLEPDDYLLAWERNAQRGLRYVHLLAEPEARQMAEAAGLTVTEIFQSDGLTHNLADYVIMQKAE